MIQFFRTIRKKLVVEGKARTYLKYAIGEIFLVVIGILIAVQINTYNEGLKKEKLKMSYIQNMINDLTKDTIQLNANLDLNQFLIMKIDSVNHFFSHPATTVDDVYAFIQNSQLFSGLRVLNNYNTNTFDILISGGNIDLFGNDFTNDLMELNRLQLSEMNVTQGNVDIYFDFYATFRYNYVGESTSINPKLRQSLWKDKNPSQVVGIYLNLIEQQTHTVNRFLDLTGKVLAQTEAVLYQLHNDVDF